MAIVGGGIAGLAIAHYLTHAQGEQDLRVSILESSGRFGGKILTESEGPLILEGGPESLLTQKPAGIELCRELGLGEQLRGSNDHARSTYVVRKGRLSPFPRNCSLITPREPESLFKCPLFSLRGKLRAAAEPLVPRSQDPDDESIASFVTRRFGKEYLDRFAGPLLSGTSVGDPNRLSIQSLFPRLVAMERNHGSLTAAVRRRERETVGSPLFTTLETGMESMVTRLVDALRQRGVSLKTDVGITEVLRKEDGFHLVPEKKRAMNQRADIVVLAVPAFVAAGMIQGMARRAASELNKIRYLGSATLALGYRESDMPNTPESSGFGFLVPPAERRTVLGCTIVSNKFGGRAEEGYAQVRAFLGGAGFEDQLDKTDNELLRATRDDLQMFLGISAQPILHRLFRWTRANPQHEVGHRGRVAKIQKAIGKHPGLFLAGSAYEGTGIPDCVKQGKTLSGTIRELIASVRT